METESAASALEDEAFELHYVDAVRANRAECERVEQRHSDEGTFISWLNGLAS